VLSLLVVLIKTEGVRRLNISKVLLVETVLYIQGGSNMTGTDLYVNKPHCAAAVRP